MTQYSDIFISDIEDIVSAGWPFISKRLQQDWGILSPVTIENIKGRAHLLNSALSLGYDLSIDKAERITLALAREFNQFEETSDIFKKMQVYWPGFSREDFLNIKGRRSVLASILQHRFALSRAHAWLQVERFFAHQN